MPPNLAARKALAARLAPYPAAPRAVIARLARDVLEVAEPILAQSPCLTPADSQAIAQERGPAYAAIIGTRGQPALPIEHASASAHAGECPRRTRGGRTVRAVLRGRRAERRLILLNLDYSAIAPLAAARLRCSARTSGGWNRRRCSTIRKPWCASSNARSASRTSRRAGSCRTSWASRSWSPPRRWPAGRRAAAHAAVRESAGRAIGRPGLRTCRALRRDQRGRGTPADRDLARCRAAVNAKSVTNRSPWRAAADNARRACPMSRIARRQAGAIALRAVGG